MSEVLASYLPRYQRKLVSAELHPSPEPFCEEKTGAIVGQDRERAVLFVAADQVGPAVAIDVGRNDRIRPGAHDQGSV